MNPIYTCTPFVEQLDFTDLKIIFELGAGRGVDTEHSFKFYEPEAFYAFEADPVNYSKMVEYLKNFDLKGRVKGYNLAVSGQNGQINFWRHPDFRSSSIIKHPTDPCEPIKVNSITLDAFCHQTRLEKIDLILSDIQGAEILAFLNQRVMLTVQYVICSCGLKAEWLPGYPVISDLEPVMNACGLKKIKEIIVFDGMVGNFLFAREEK
jgi:FkbM family methyltransferase